jgi:hypothetical protein
MRLSLPLCYCVFALACLHRAFVAAIFFDFLLLFSSSLMRHTTLQAAFSGRHFGSCLLLPSLRYTANYYRPTLISSASVASSSPHSRSSNYPTFPTHPSSSFVSHCLPSTIIPPGPKLKLPRRPSQIPDTLISFTRRLFMRFGQVRGSMLWREAWLQSA